MSSAATPDPRTIAAAADVFDSWTADDVFPTMTVTEAAALAALMAELDQPETAKHIVRQTWLAESDGDRDPLPWANGHDSRLSEAEYIERIEDLGHNEGLERFYFEPRLTWPEDEA